MKGLKQERDNIRFAFFSEDGSMWCDDDIGRRKPLGAIANVQMRDNDGLGRARTVEERSRQIQKMFEGQGQHR